MFNLFGKNNTPRTLTPAEVSAKEKESKEADRQLELSIKYVKAEGNVRVKTAKRKAVWRSLDLADAQVRGIEEGIDRAISGGQKQAYQAGLNSVNRYARSLVGRSK